MLLNNILLLGVFTIISIVVVFSAAYAVFSRNIVHAVFALFFTLCGMAGYYFLLSADFLAVMQIVVYAGGILVLMLLCVFLTQHTLEEPGIEKRKQYIPGILAGILIYIILLYIIGSSFWRLIPPTPMEPTTTSLGALLLTKYLLTFEIASITLLIALVGATYLVRRGDHQ